MAFIKYTGSRAMFKSARPILSINKDGNMFINKCGIRIFFDWIDGKEYCVLHYNEKNDNIGIQVTNDANAEGARRMTKKKDGTFSISGRGFVKYFGIPLKDKNDKPISRRYLLKECDDAYFDGIIAVPYKEKK